MGKENGQIEEIEGGKSEDEIEIESDMPCKVEPTEVETIQEISKVSHTRMVLPLEISKFKQSNEI